MQLTGLVFIIITTTIFHRSLCYSFGAPSEVCEDMTPNHGYPGQTGPSPYKIRVEKLYYMPGENVKVFIESLSDNIAGYLIQARQVGAQFNTAAGTFETPPVNGQYLNCGNSKVKIFLSV